MPDILGFIDSRRAARYGIAVVLPIAALLIYRAMTHAVSGELPTYIVFYPAVIITAVLCGMRPGLLATALSALLAAYWIIPPEGFAISGTAGVMGLIFFSSMGIFLSVVSEWYRRARRKAAAYDKDLAVRQQHEWLRVTLSSIGDAVLATDTAGRITFLNPVAAAMTGWAEAEAAGRPVTEVFRIINEQTRQTAEDIVARVLRDGRTVMLANHTALLACDGREIPIEDSAAPIKDAAGKLVGAVLVFHDVTAKRRAEQALRESERSVRAKLESILSPEADIGELALEDIIDVTAVQSLMDDFYKLARFPMALIDVKGKVLVGVGWQEVCTKFHRVHPEACRHCMESDTQLTIDVPAGEFKLYKCKNNMWDVATPVIIGGRHLGNLFTGQFFFDDEPVDYEAFRAQARRYDFDEKQYLAALQAVPRFSRDFVNAGMGYLIKLANMISQSSYSGVKLARSLAQRDALTDSLNQAQEIAHQGSWELDLVANRLSWSDEVYRIFGLRPREFGATYEAFLAAVHPDDRAAVDAAYGGSLRDGRDSYEIEHRVVRKDDGEVRVVHEKCRHIRDEGGKIIRSVGMVHDITERKRSEANQSLTASILRVLNRGEGGLHTMIGEVLRLIKGSAGLDAVGLRVREGDDYPYYEQSGFAEDFVQKENFLCVRGGDGAVIRDADGRTTLECTCGVVLSGQSVPDMPCFTEGGSFWTNASSQLLELEPEHDPRQNPRNRCIHAGYQSVALVPVHSGEEIVGLLQLNTRPEGRFSPELIRFFEGLANNIGLALQRKGAEDEIRQRVDELQEANNELARFNNAAVDRELRMIELKKQINELCAAAGKPPRYNTSFYQDKA